MTKALPAFRNPQRGSGGTAAIAPRTGLAGGEVALFGALLLAIVMSALGVLRPAREAMGVEGGIETLRWLFVGTALATLAVGMGFSRLVDRFAPFKAATTAYSLIALSLVAFWWLRTYLPASHGVIGGQLLYVWYSVFSLFATLLAWSLLVPALAGQRAGRSFSIVAIGGSLGALLGPGLALPIAAYAGADVLALVSAGLFLGALILARAMLRQRQAPMIDQHQPSGDAAEGGSIAASSAPGRGVLGGYGLYVLVLAALTTVIYFAKVELVSSAGASLDARAALFASIDVWANVGVLLVQLGLSTQLIPRPGLHVAMILLPASLALGFAFVAFNGSLIALVAIESLARAMQRGFVRPAREQLFSTWGDPDTHRAKAFIDTSIYRAGDVIGAQAGLVAGKFGAGLAVVAGLMVPVALAWALLGLWLGYRHRTQARRATGPPET